MNLIEHNPVRHTGQVVPADIRVIQSLGEFSPEQLSAKNPKDRLSRNRLTRIGNAALLEAKKITDFLKHDGIAPILTSNAHGDQQLRGDIYAEKAVLHVLTNTDIFWLVRSEEHGYRLVGNGITPETFGLIDERLVREKRWDELKVQDSNDLHTINPAHVNQLLLGTIQPEAFASIDGWDGSKAAEGYHTGKKGEIYTRFATMLALAPVADPTYDQFTFGGMYEHAYRGEDYDPETKGRLIFATKGKGAYEITPHKYRRLESVRDERLVLGPDTPGYYLRYNYFGGDGKAIESFMDEHAIPRTRLLATASHFADMVTGAQISMEAPEGEQPIVLASPDQQLQPVIFVAETTRKGREEFAADFVIGDEVGVVFRALIDGQPRSIRHRNFLTWSEGELIPVVAARSEKVANQLIRASRPTRVRKAA